MAEKKRTPVWVWWILAAVFLVACGVSVVRSFTNAHVRVSALNTVKVVGLAYHRYQEANNRPPRSFDELSQFARSKGIDLPAEAADVTVNWGAGVGPLNRDGPEGEVVLGHLPAPNGKGVIVLYVDGSVKEETNETLSRAKSARPLPAQ